MFNIGTKKAVVSYSVPPVPRLSHVKYWYKGSGLIFSIGTKAVV